MSARDPAQRAAWRKEGRCTKCGGARDGRRLRCLMCLRTERKNNRDRRRRLGMKPRTCTECYRVGHRSDTCPELT